LVSDNQPQLTPPADGSTIVDVIPAKRIAGVLLAIAIAVATLASRQATHVNRRSHAVHGCQAAGPGGAVATFEAADVSGPVHQTPSTPGMSAHAGTAVTPAADGRSIHSAFCFARPHDPPHLHAFSLLI
jgi:hypothetical protein